MFRGSTAVRRRWLTRKQLRGPAWRRLRQDVYADARLDVTHRVLVSAVGLTLPPGAGFAGVSAAVLWGQCLPTPIAQYRIFDADGFVAK